MIFFATLLFGALAGSVLGAGHTAEILKDCPLCADEINACAADTACDVILTEADNAKDDWEPSAADLTDPLFVAAVICAATGCPDDDEDDSNGDAETKCSSGCDGGSFCNNDSGTERGVCERCDNHAGVCGCFSDGLPELGALACAETCFAGDDFGSCEGSGEGSPSGEYDDDVIFNNGGSDDSSGDGNDCDACDAENTACALDAACRDIGMRMAGGAAPSADDMKNEAWSATLSCNMLNCAGDGDDSSGDASAHGSSAGGLENDMPKGTGTMMPGMNTMMGPGTGMSELDADQNGAVSGGSDGGSNEASDAEIARTVFYGGIFVCLLYIAYTYGARKAQGTEAHLGNRRSLENQLSDQGVATFPSNQRTTSMPLAMATNLQSSVSSL